MGVSARINKTKMAAAHEYREPQTDVACAEIVRLCAAGDSDALEAYFTNTLTTSLGCLKISHLVSVIRAAAAAPIAARARCFPAAVSSIMCLCDVFARVRAGMSPVVGYVPPEVLSTETVAREFAATFGEFADDMIFDDAMRENDAICREYDGDMELFKAIHERPDASTTRARWLQHSSEFIGNMSADDITGAYLRVVARCANVTEYKKLQREILLHQIALRRANQYMREFAAAIVAAAPVSAAAPVAATRPQSTPVSVHASAHGASVARPRVITRVHFT